ncbi:MAG: DUF3943 domain-containing protein [Bacteroidaceae bacterium]|nr:DUF3943 domain-containing protein [Bacteroidaceae bacterium]
MVHPSPRLDNLQSSINFVDSRLHLGRVQASLTLLSVCTRILNSQSKKRPWRAAAEVLGINLGVHAFDRLVMNEEFAQVKPKHIWHNLKNGFVWDNDQFATNLFAHPYHGNLYFNAARSNGLSFFASAPYALGGSLMWEMAGEIEPPAINDLIATTIGGIAIGEVAHRVSDMILDNKAKGFPRFVREFTAGVVNPMKALNRLITGEAWKVDRSSHSQTEQSAYDFSMTFGDRYLADKTDLFLGENNPYLDFKLKYGNPFDEDRRKPYDHFIANVTFGLSKNQPLVNSIHLLGRLWGTPINTGTDMKVEFGLFQHFNYYDSSPVRKDTDRVPYRISEAASIGPGVIYDFPTVGNLARLEQRIFLNAILLGGTKSDYYNVIDRDYNMGSGLSVKMNSLVEFSRMGRFLLNVDYYRLYTWKGYEGKDLATVDPLYLNAQGDKGNALLLVINPNAEINLNQNFRINVSAFSYIRRTFYKYHPNVHFNTFELRLGLSYHL